MQAILLGGAIIDGTPEEIRDYLDKRIRKSHPTRSPNGPPSFPWPDGPLTENVVKPACTCSRPENPREAIWKPWRCDLHPQLKSTLL